MADKPKRRSSEELKGSTPEWVKKYSPFPKGPKPPCPECSSTLVFGANDITSLESGVWIWKCWDCGKEFLEGE